MTLQPVCAGAPDPFAPIECQPLAVGQPSVRKLRQRRAEFLARTRQLVAEMGVAQFTLRRLSDHCGVTVQTLHNSFGCRTQLLISAMNEFTSRIEQTAHQRTSDLTYVLERADVTVACAREHPQFMRQMIETAFHGPVERKAMQGHASNCRASMLRMVSTSIRPEISPQALSGQITSMNMFALYEWALHDDLAELRQKLIWGNQLVLMGAAEPAHMGLVQNWSGQS